MKNLKLQKVTLNGHVLTTLDGELTLDGSPISSASGSLGDESIYGEKTFENPSIFNSGIVVYDNASQSIVSANRGLYANEVDVVSWSQGELSLKNSIGSRTVEWGNGLLNDGSSLNGVAVDFFNRRLYGDWSYTGNSSNPSGMISKSYLSGNFASLTSNDVNFNGSEGLPSIYCGQRILGDSNDIYVLDWENRQLIGDWQISNVVTTTGDQTITGKKAFKDTIFLDGLYGFFSATGRITLSPSGFNDTSGVNSVNPQLRRLYARDTFTTIDYGITQLSHSGEHGKTLDWSYRELYDSSFEIPLNWEDRTLSGEWSTNSTYQEANSVANYGTVYSHVAGPTKIYQFDAGTDINVDGPITSDYISGFPPSEYIIVISGNGAGDATVTLLDLGANNVTSGVSVLVKPLDNDGGYAVEVQNEGGTTIGVGASSDYLYGRTGAKYITDGISWIKASW